MSDPAWDQAIASGDADAVRRLLAAGLDVNARDRHGNTGLMRAAQLGHLPVVQALIAAGAALDVTGKYRLSALMLAIVSGHAAVARVLVGAGCDLALAGSGAPGFAGKSAFDLAAARGDMDDLLDILRPAWHVLLDILRPAWHVLLAPLPPGARVRRQPVASPEVMAMPEGAAIAGWQQLTVELSAGAAGLRHVLVVLDADGRPLSASDTVLYCREVPARREVELRQESVGGRLEPDGTVRGTRWLSVAVQPASSEDDPRWEATPSAPTPDDVAALRALVADVMARRPSA